MEKFVGKISFNFITFDTIDNKNYTVHSERSGRCYGIVIRAKLDDKFVHPETFEGKRALVIIDNKCDRSGRKRPYIYLYGRSSNLDDTAGLATFKVAQLAEKETTAGAVSRHEFNINPLIDVSILSRGGTHWDRQVVFFTNESVKVSRFYRSNLGNTKHFTYNL